MSNGIAAADVARIAGQARRWWLSEFAAGLPLHQINNLHENRKERSPAARALLEGFDAEGRLVDRASLESVPGRKAPGDPVPIFTMTVKGGRIAYIQFSGPREGEYLAADKVSFTPIDR
jgi:hypothetical protein